MQTNLKITLVGLSTILALSDEDQLIQHKPADEQVGTDFDVHHLDLRCQDILLDIQVTLYAHSVSLYCLWLQILWPLNSEHLENQTGMSPGVEIGNNCQVHRLR